MTDGMMNLRAPLEKSEEGGRASIERQRAGHSLATAAVGVDDPCGDAQQTGSGLAAPKAMLILAQESSDITLVG
jgi:hypothetical protein